MFCVECGSEEQLYGHICKKCLLSKNLVTPPGYVELQICQGCMRVLDGSIWRDMSPEDRAATLLGEASKKHAQVESLRWVVPEFAKEKGEHRLKCKAVADVAGQELDMEFDIGMRVRLQKCQSCSRQSGDYYEAVIQLRLDDLSAKDAELELSEENELVFKMVDEASADENAFITKFMPVKGGMDYYLGSVQLARAVANKFRNRYGASVNESPSLVGMKDGRDLYRYSIVVRFPKHREGDVVALDKVIHIVEASSGKELVLKHAVHGQKVRVQPNDSRIKNVANRHELRNAVVVTHDKSTIQVLDPESLAAVTLQRPSFLRKIGETVRVVRYDDALHIV